MTGWFIDCWSMDAKWKDGCMIDREMMGRCFDGGWWLMFGWINRWDSWMDEWTNDMLWMEKCINTWNWCERMDGWIVLGELMAGWWIAGYLVWGASACSMGWWMDGLMGRWMNDLWWKEIDWWMDEWYWDGWWMYGWMDDGMRMDGWMIGGRRDRGTD